MEQETRKCRICGQDKALMAFIGSRPVCRLCFLDLSKEEKLKYVLNEKFLKQRKERRRIRQDPKSY